MINFLKNGTNTSDATATTIDLLSPKTAYVQGSKITGAITPTYGDELSVDVIESSWTGSVIFDINETYHVALVGTINSTQSLKIYGIDNNHSLTNKLAEIPASVWSSYTLRTAKISQTLNASGKLNIVIASNNSSRIGRIAFVQLDLNNYTYISAGATPSGESCWNYTSIALAINPVYSNIACITLQGRQNSRAEAGARTLVYNYNSETNAMNNLYDQWYQPLSSPDFSSYMSEWDDLGLYCLVGSGKLVNQVCRILKYNPTSNSMSTVSTINYSGNKCMLKSGFWIQNNTLKNISNTTLKTYSELSSSSYKWYIDNYLFSLSGNTVTIYLIDWADYRLNEVKKLSLTSSSGTYETLQRPYSNGVKYLLNSTTLYYVEKEGYNNITKLTRSGTTYVDTSGATALASDVIESKTAYIGGIKVTGTMPNNGALTYTPTTSQQTIPAGYTSGGTIEAVDNTIDDNIQAENIKKGVEILGVTGTLEQGSGSTTILDTSDESVSVSGTTLIFEEPEYTELEYIESTGTQYINTEFIPRLSGTTIKFSVKNLDSNNFYFSGLCEQVATTTDNDLHDVYYGMNFGSCGWNTGYPGNPDNLIFSYNFNTTDIYNVEYRGGDLYINNTFIINSPGTSTNGVYHTFLYLFARNQMDTNYQGGKFRLYSSQILYNNKLVRDFIPVKDTNNVVCLYDKITKTYFYNQGTGVFVAGPEI